MSVPDQADDGDFPTAEWVDHRSRLLFRFFVHFIWLSDLLFATGCEFARPAVCLDGMLEVGELPTEFGPGCWIAALGGHDHGQPDRDAHRQVVRIKLNL